MSNRQIHQLHNEKLSISVVIIEDEKDMVHIIAILLDESSIFNATAIVISTLDETERILKDEKKERYFDLILLDLNLPGSYGAQHTVDAVHKLAPETPILIMTGLDPISPTINKLVLPPAARIIFKGPEMTAESLTCNMSHSLSAKFVYERKISNNKTLEPIGLAVQTFNFTKYLSLTCSQLMALLVVLISSHYPPLQILGYSVIVWVIVTLNFIADPNKEIQLPSILRLESKQDKE